MGALCFGFKNIEQATIVGQPGERVADGEVADLFEQARIVEQSAAESDGVAGDGERLREDERGIKQALRLRGGNLCGEIHPGGGVDGAVERGIFELEAPTKPDYGDQE